MKQNWPCTRWEEKRSTQQSPACGWWNKTEPVDDKRRKTTDPVHDERREEAHSKAQGVDDGAGLAPGHGGEHLHGQHEGEIDGGGDGKLAQEVHAQ